MIAKRFLMTVFLLFIGLSVIFPAQAKTLRLGHAVNTKSPYHVGAREFAECLQKSSSGSLKVKIYPNRQLGDERALIEGIRMGIVDLVVTSTGPLSNFAPDFAALDVPYLFTGYDEVDLVLGGKTGEHFLKSLRDNDIIGLAFWENGFRHVTNNKRPVEIPADIKGIKIRTMENKIHMRCFDYLGARAQALPFGEALAALRQGALDGQENPVNIIHAFNLQELQKYLSLTGHVYSPAVIICSPKTWKSLSNEQQNRLRQCAVKAAQTEKEFIRSREQKMLQELQDKGMFINTVDKQAFRKKLGPLREEFEKDMPWLEKIEADLNQY
ncbi:MAG: TRAP transporter substrate-binding protein [Desulfovibrionales bacterium]